MGTWGTGNFDNDGALDYAASVIDGLYSRIEATFADETVLYLDEDGEAVLMPSVQMISVLCEHCCCCPPKADVIAGWQERYLAVFDAQIEGLGSVGEYATERRAVIVQTFEKLHQQAQEFWRES